MSRCPYNRRAVIDAKTDTDVKVNTGGSSERVFIERESLVWGTQQGIFLANSISRSEGGCW